MPTAPSNSFLPGRSRRDRLRSALTTGLLAVAVAGCQTTPIAGTANPTFVLGTPVFSAGSLGSAQVKTIVDPNGSGGTYFSLALPDESTLLKQVTKVAGTAGAMNTLLSASATPVITDVIPNKVGFTVEGAHLDKTTLTFILGSTTLTVAKRTAAQVTLTIPKNAPTSGTFTVRDGTTQLVRTTMDANNVYVNGRVMIKFVDGAPRAAVEKALLAAGMLYYRYPGMNYVVGYYDMTQSFAQVQTALMKQTAVFQEITRDTLYADQGVAPAVPVNDPNYNQQWALPMIHAPQVWQYTTGSPDVVVAVLDTGIDMTHPDLAPNIFKNTYEVPGNSKDDDANGRIDDYNGWNCYDQTGNVQDDNGHGTEVAGVIAAVANNTKGIAGLAYSTRIMPVKVMNAQGQATTSTIVDGINYAVRNRASVISMSLGSLIDDAPLKAAVQFAITYNVPVIAAMGNDGARIKEYPAAYSTDTGLIAVGPTNSVDVRPDWGTFGEWMTVSAPGENIETTTVGGGYGLVSGSSIATAYVAAEAALIKAAKPVYTPAEVRNVIVTTVVDRGTPGFDPDYGYGRINFDDTLQSVIGNVNLFASSQHFTGEFPVALAGDKNSETYWSSAREGSNDPQWLELDLGAPTTLTSIAALSPPYYPFLFPADFTIELSSDQTSWHAVAGETNFQVDTSTWHRWNISPQIGRYVRFNITKSRQNPDNALYYDLISEVALNGEETSIVANSSSDYYGINYPTSYMTDKDPNTFWVSANRKQMQPEFAIADMGVSKVIHSIDMLSPPAIISEAFPKTVDFFVSDDKVNWTLAGSAKNLVAQPSAWYKFPVNQVSGRYIKLQVDETNYAKSNGTLYSGYQLEGYTAAVAEVDVNRP